MLALSARDAAGAGSAPVTVTVSAPKCRCVDAPIEIALAGDQRGADTTSLWLLKPKNGGKALVGQMKDSILVFVLDDLPPGRTTRLCVDPCTAPTADGNFGTGSAEGAGHGTGSGEDAVYPVYHGQWAEQTFFLSYPDARGQAYDPTVEG